MMDAYEKSMWEAAQSLRTTHSDRTEHLIRESLSDQRARDEKRWQEADARDALQSDLASLLRQAAPHVPSGSPLARMIRATLARVR